MLGTRPRGGGWMKHVDESTELWWHPNFVYNQPFTCTFISRSFSFFGELKRKQVWLPFLLCLMAMFFQQWSGINVIIFNTVTIFNAAEVKVDQYLATNVVGLVQLIATVCEC